MEDISYFYTVSGGIAMLDEDTSDYFDLIKCAVSALEFFKKNGENKCTIYSSELLSDSLHRMEITSQLQRSILTGMKDFFLVYQPFVEVNGLDSNGAEALLRWTSLTYGSIGSVEFVMSINDSKHVFNRCFIEVVIKLYSIVGILVCVEGLHILMNGIWFVLWMSIAFKDIIFVSLLLKRNLNKSIIITNQ